MKTYTNRNTAPLVFHEINRFVRIPVSICYLLLTTFFLFPGLTYPMLGDIDLFFTVIFLILLIVAFLGCKDWKPSAWYAFIALSAVGIIYNILYLRLAWYLESLVFAIRIVNIIFDVCVIIYYFKRKPLFFQSAQPQISNINEGETISSETSAAPTKANMQNPQPSKKPTTESTNVNPFKLFQSIQCLAEDFCDNKTMFPSGATLKDKEIAYIYVYYLYNRENTLHNYFDIHVFQAALEYINETFQANFGYTDEMMKDLNNLQREKLAFFVALHDEFINTRENQEPNLSAYTKSILAEFPNVSFEDPSAGVIVTELFYTAKEKIRVFKEELASTANKKEKYPMDSVSNTAQPQKFGNAHLILCIIALIASLIGNIYQSILSQSLTQEVINQQNAFTQSKEYMEYEFYHNNAVVLVEEDPNCYHTYDCPNINEYDFWICNREAATYSGFSPCPDCILPQ